MERAVALATSAVIEVDDLPATVRGDYAVAVLPSIERDETLRAWGSRYARLVLERCHGNKREACRILDISYHTLQSYLRYPIGRDVGPDDVDAEATPTAELKAGPPDPSMDAEA
jgi:DNA-binding NtrC family response regulator